MSVQSAGRQHELIKFTRPGISSYAADVEVTAVAQTYVIGQEIKGMTFTTSRTGITVKDLVCK